MEEMSEGHCDSDVSDTWSIVDFKPEDSASSLKNSLDSGLPAEPVINHQELTAGLDECYELTELTLSSADPLGVSDSPPEHLDEGGVPAKSTVPSAESDCDTDGISVISEDEEYVNWRQAAHDNYQNTMRLLESSPEILSRTCPLENEPTYAYEQHETVEFPQSEAEGMTELMPETTHTIPRPQSLVPPDESWQQNCAHFLTKHFFTSAVIAALACIALAHFLKTGTGKAKVAEMLEALERLKGENDALKFQLNDITQAYATLEAKVQSAEIPTGPCPQKETIISESSQGNPEKQDLGRAKDMIPLLMMFSKGKEPNIEAVTTKLDELLHAIPNDLAEGDFKILDQKIVSCISKILKKGSLHLENRVKRLSDLTERLEKKLTRSNEVQKKYLKSKEKVEAGLKIIQWYPENDLESVNPKLTLISEPTIPNPLTAPEEQTLNSVPEEKKNEIPSGPQLNGKSHKSEKISKSPKIKQCFYDPKKKCKLSKFEEKSGKFSKDKVKGCDQGRNKTGAWFLERGRGRELNRRAAWQGEWQFARGRKDLKKIDEGKTLWYFRRSELHARSRL